VDTVVDVAGYAVIWLLWLRGQWRGAPGC